MRYTINEKGDKTQDYTNNEKEMRIGGRRRESASRDGFTRAKKKEE
jgi:hypothetical protein